ncbi:MAG: 5-(carboxyamino)imidazole ribonucleotide mutase [Synergistota bacterium]|nr:5-(carboxyamino)imidazole ribonucleotide mutase [Synergistota bacterium]
MMKKIAVLMGSLSDRAVADRALEVLKSYGVPHEVLVCSAHRTPGMAASFAASARDEGFGAIICIAGMAAHLAGAVAANTTLPVVGVPVASGGLGGMDALLATVQMPTGIPVATVAVGGAANAALLCVQMLALSDDGLAAKLRAARGKMEQDALEANRRLKQELAGARDA